MKLRQSKSKMTSAALNFQTFQKGIAGHLVQTPHTVAHIWLDQRLKGRHPQGKSLHRQF